MDLITTLPGSLMEHFFPAGWNLAEIDRVGALAEADVVKRQSWWHPQFEPIACGSYGDFDTYMGHEIAREIKLTRQASRPLILILPVGPMGMYRWTVYFLKEWGVSCEHVHGFNMDEWSDAQGHTLPADNPGAFQYAMEHAFYGPLGKLTVPSQQRHFALKTQLPAYAAQIADLKKQGGELVTVFGIGRVCHIAFWEPHFAAEFAGVEDWKKQTHRLGARLHPLTIEHKALVFSQFTSFLAIVRQRLDADKIIYEYLDGRTRDRAARVERFQNDPECKLFLISLKAGGLGLNLTAAEYVFLLDPWWNPAVEAQAIDRTHRIGQTRPVFAYRLIARDTVEEKVLELQKSKRALADAIINADNSVIRNLGREDLELLLS